MSGEQALSVAVPAAIEAGEVLLRHFRGPLQSREKAPRDLVTEADFASERILLDHLRSAFPDHRIISEEAGDCGAGSGPTWYIDPLDGTANFARGLPAFCVALALEDQGQITAAVVHDPLHQETFSAVRRQGAALNSAPLKVSAVAAMNEALLATGFPSPRRHRGASGDLFMRVAMGTRAIRRIGSSALDLAWLAAGRLDAFWEMGLQPWDVAGGSLLVEEAGGRVTGLDGGPWRPGCVGIVATNAHLHAELMALMAESHDGMSKQHCTG